jgi:hypothetical protein
MKKNVVMPSDDSQLFLGGFLRIHGITNSPPVRRPRAVLLVEKMMEQDDGAGWCVFLLFRD